MSLTKEEAKRLMKKGVRVRHESWRGESWATYVDGFVVEHFGGVTERRHYLMSEISTLVEFATGWHVWEGEQ